MRLGGGQFTTVLDPFGLLASFAYDNNVAAIVLCVRVRVWCIGGEVIRRGSWCCMSLLVEP